MLDWVTKCIVEFPAQSFGEVSQFDAQSDCGLRNIMVSSDPPYYDNIGYADLSDFFYVWMRQSLKETYPKLFRTMLVPKAEELVATPTALRAVPKKQGTSLRMVCCTPASKSISMPARMCR